MVTKRDDDRPTDDRVNIEESASGRWAGRVLQFLELTKLPSSDHTLTMWICQYDPAAEST